MTRLVNVALLAAAVAWTAPAAGQEEQGQEAPARPPGEPELVFERETFEYPEYERRNPFRPLLANETGPRFENITLRGIIFSPDPRQSLALLSTGAQAGQQGEAGGSAQRTRRVHVGETWGNVTVLEIRRDHVVVEVEEFGMTERQVLQLQRRGAQGGSR